MSHNVISRRTPAGTIHVVDPSPFNWLHVLENTMEAPVKADRNGRVIPALAAGLKWVDDCILEMRLRERLVFQDGQRLTSKSVKENFKELQRWPSPHSFGSWLNFHEETKIIIVDEHTVQLQFPYPDGLVPGKLRFFHIAASNFWRKIGFGYAKQGTGDGHWSMLDAPGPWGSGPFSLTDGHSSILSQTAIVKKNPFASAWLTLREDRSPYIVLQANQNYWNPIRSSKLERVIFRNDLSYDHALRVCTSTEGQVDLVTGVLPKDAEKVVRSPYTRLVNEKGNQVIAGIFNLFRRDVNFSDRKLRLAFNLAIDREEIVRKGFKGYADLVPALTPSWAADFPENLQPRQSNPARARQLLKNARWRQGRPVKLASTEKYQTIARLIASQLRTNLQIEAEVTIVQTDQELSFLKTIAEKKLVPNWDIFLTDATASFSEDTPFYVHREFFGSSGALRAGPKLVDFDQLYKRMVIQTDRKNRINRAKAIDQFIFEQAYALFLCIPQSLYAVNKQVHFTPYKTMLDLAETEVTEKHWSRRR
ncbi:ABC transporter substrate-binding protein [Mesobacillus foraminis]|uniref:ABC transporter substrate-binding protein n=1 Tax=Mesobacillus foraminis TaxID=279826 RepID=UPI00399F99CF